MCGCKVNVKKIEIVVLDSWDVVSVGYCFGNVLSGFFILIEFFVKLNYYYILRIEIFGDLWV